MAKNWFEDFVAGEAVEGTSEVEMTEAEILDFARQYDPQPFHTDKEAAASSIYGGLIASGWHTASVMMRLLVGEFIPRQSSLGSPGIDELRWLQPVRPGDRLRLRVTTVETVRSRSKPDRGVVHSITEVLNQDGAVVMRVKAMGMYLTRPA
jgi:acyl dehydratase